MIEILIILWLAVYTALAPANSVDWSNAYYLMNNLIIIYLCTISTFGYTKHPKLVKIIMYEFILTLIFNIISIFSVNFMLKFNDSVYAVVILVGAIIAMLIHNRIEKKGSALKNYAVQIWKKIRT